jgi:hypothetical protein
MCKYWDTTWRAMHVLGRHPKFDKAEALFRKALRVREVFYGYEHQKVAEVLEFYGSLLRRVGRDNDAEAVLTRASKIRARRLP